jgi:Na+-translocating ferredoxin:NAD+ oxidoreductase RNF subunit RnfB
MGAEEMAKKLALVILEDCIGCEACVAACPTGAMQMNDEDLAISDSNKCDGEEECGECSPVCPVECILYVEEGDERLHWES